MSAASELVTFLNESPTPYHAVASCVNRLTAAGFRPLDESNAQWDLKPGGYFLTKADSAIIAFRVPENKWESFHILGAHTDSPHFKIKSKPERLRQGVSQLLAEPYGGILLYTWFDRDLQLAGRVLAQEDKRLQTHLVALEEPLLTLPSLAIHLQPEVNSKGFAPNKQTQMIPVVGISDKFSLKKVLADALGISDKHILGFDLSLYDAQEACLGGINRELIYAARLDNLAMVHAGLSALLASGNDSTALPVVSFFDHEEVGSGSFAGAQSSFLSNTLERIVYAQNGARPEFLAKLSSSVFVSADMAHAYHPNYPEKYEENHQPFINQGPVIKINRNQRYTTDGETEALFERLSNEAGVSVQRYMNRADLGCGSTIGPAVAANLGVRAVDVGNPMWGMHSIRETAGANDHENITRVFQAFFDSDIQ